MGVPSAGDERAEVGLLLRVWDKKCTCAGFDGLVDKVTLDKEGKRIEVALDKDGKGI